MNQRYPLIGTLVVALLSGCASTFNTGESTFNCQDNENCPTPLEVYEGTHSAPHDLEMGRTPRDWGAGGAKWKRTGTGDSDDKDEAGKYTEELTQRALNLATTRGARYSVDGGQDVRPIREPSQVMRVWIAPWIDSQDNLHWTGYVFTEVSPRRWSFGEQQVRHLGMPQISPNAR